MAKWGRYSKHLTQCLWPVTLINVAFKQLLILLYMQICQQQVDWGIIYVAPRNRHKSNIALCKLSSAYLVIARSWWETPAWIHQPIWAGQVVLQGNIRTCVYYVHTIQEQSVSKDNGTLMYEVIYFPQLVLKLWARGYKNMSHWRNFERMIAI